jgi:hypothetical protein
MIMATPDPMIVIAIQGVQASQVDDLTVVESDTIEVVEKRGMGGLESLLLQILIKIAADLGVKGIKVASNLIVGLLRRFKKKTVTVTVPKNSGGTVQLFFREEDLPSKEEPPSVGDLPEEPIGEEELPSDEAASQEIEKKIEAAMSS